MQHAGQHRRNGSSRHPCHVVCTLCDRRCRQGREAGSAACRGVPRPVPHPVPGSSYRHLVGMPPPAGQLHSAGWAGQRRIATVRCGGQQWRNCAGARAHAACRAASAPPWRVGTEAAQHQRRCIRLLGSSRDSSGRGREERREPQLPRRWRLQPVQASRCGGGSGVRRRCCATTALLSAVCRRRGPAVELGQMDPHAARPRSPLLVRPAGARAACRLHSVPRQDALTDGHGVPCHAGILVRSHLSALTEALPAPTLTPRAACTCSPASPAPPVIPLQRREPVHPPGPASGTRPGAALCHQAAIRRLGGRAAPAASAAAAARRPPAAALPCRQRAAQQQHGKGGGAANRGWCSRHSSRGRQQPGGMADWRGFSSGGSGSGQRAVSCNGGPCTTCTHSKNRPHLHPLQLAPAPAGGSETQPGCAGGGSLTVSTGKCCRRCAAATFVE